MVKKAMHVRQKRYIGLEMVTKGTREFDFLKEHGYGVVYGMDEVLDKIREIGRRMPLESPRKPAGEFK